MARQWRVQVLQNQLDDSKVDLNILRLTKAQVAMIRCMLECDYEVDPVEDWGFKRKDGDLQSFRLNLAQELTERGF